jgi:exodeoxyribonuclease VII small subunit
VARISKTGSGKGPSRDEGPEAPTLGIDEILDGLEQVVAQLEAGELPLEQALQRFEHGVGLARRGSALLDAVEERVEQLLAERDQAVPLRDDDDDGG